MIKFLKEQKAEKANLLMEHLHSAMFSMETPRDNKMIHASSVTSGLCPRAEILIAKYKVTRPKRPISVPLRYTFDEGKDKQARFNNYWMKSYHVGNWVCDRCGKEAIHVKGSELESQSKDCYSHRWLYDEVVFKDKRSGITGSIDSILDLLPPSPYTMAELKIIKGDDFIALHGPLGEHRLRTQLYLYLISQDSGNPLSAKIDTTRAHVVYMMRGYGKKHEDHGISPFKDFVVKRNDDAIMPYVNKGYCLTMARKLSVEPARICNSMTCTMAKQCPVSKQCFSTPDGILGWVGGKFKDNVELVDVTA